MDCHKKKYCLDDILDKIDAGISLDHCEELYYLVRMHGMCEEEAERLLYGSGDNRTGTEKL